MCMEFSVSFTKELYGIFLNESEISEIALFIRDFKNKSPLYQSLKKSIPYI